MPPRYAFSSIAVLKPSWAARLAVIAGQGHAHDVRGLDLAVTHHRPLLAGADRKDRRLRRVDDSGEMADAEHAEVGDRGRAALVFLRLELAGPRPRGEILHLVGDLRQRLALGVEVDWRVQAAGHGDGDTDLGVFVLYHAGLGPAHIAVVDLL